MTLGFVLIVKGKWMVVDGEEISRWRQFEESAIGGNMNDSILGNRDVTCLKSGRAGILVSSWFNDDEQDNAFPDYYQYYYDDIF